MHGRPSGLLAAAPQRPRWDSPATARGAAAWGGRLARVLTGCRASNSCRRLACRAGVGWRASSCCSTAGRVHRAAAGVGAQLLGGAGGAALQLGGGGGGGGCAHAAAGGSPRRCRCCRLQALRLQLGSAGHQQQRLPCCPWRACGFTAAARGHCVPPRAMGCCTAAEAACHRLGRLDRRWGRRGAALRGQRPHVRCLGLEDLCCCHGCLLSWLCGGW